MGFVFRKLHQELPAIAKVACLGAPVAILKFMYVPPAWQYMVSKAVSFIVHIFMSFFLHRPLSGPAAPSARLTTAAPEAVTGPGS